LGKYSHYDIDISQDVNKLREIFKKYDFDTIVNLAQMPSAPFAQDDLNKAS
jgi:dTDP-4-dehydrorhamnose reductase